MRTNGIFGDVNIGQVDASPMPIGSPVLRHQRRRSDAIASSIFGNFVYQSDALPEKPEHPWAPEQPHVITPASGSGIATVSQVLPTAPSVPLNGFGADVYVDHSISTGMRWAGHGIFGGKDRHGGYAMSRYGQPVSGMGLSYPVGSRIPATQTRKVHGIFSGILGALGALGAALAGPKTSPDVLMPGESLAPGEYIQSQNGLYRFTTTVKGGYVQQWPGTPDAKIVFGGTDPNLNIVTGNMQTDGNFVFYSGVPGPSTVVWATNTNGHPGARMQMTNDGRLIVFGPDNSVVWASAPNPLPAPGPAPSTIKAAAPPVAAPPVAAPPLVAPDVDLRFAPPPVADGNLIAGVPNLYLGIGVAGLAVGAFILSKAGK